MVNVLFLLEKIMVSRVVDIVCELGVTTSSDFCVGALGWWETETPLFVFLWDTTKSFN